MLTKCSRLQTSVGSETVGFAHCYGGIYGICNVGDCQIDPHVGEYDEGNDITERADEYHVEFGAGNMRRR